MVVCDNCRGAENVGARSFHRGSGYSASKVDLCSLCYDDIVHMRWSLLNGRKYKEEHQAVAVKPSAPATQDPYYQELFIQFGWP